ncbi:hypothetical protein [Novipirellula rosea]
MRLSCWLSYTMANFPASIIFAVPSSVFNDLWTKLQSIRTDG